MKKIYYILFICLVMASCSEVGYDDNYFIKNDLRYPVTVSRYDNNNICDTIIVESHETVLYLSVSGFGSSPFDDDINTVCITQNVFIINDTISVTYKPTDTYDKNPCMTHSWKILEEDSKKKQTSHKVLYTITEEDYQNALSH